MDTMFWTKMTGALCGSLLIFLLVHWGAEEMYHVGGYGDHGGEYGDDHGDDHEKVASALAWIVIEEDTEVAVVEEEVVEVAFADVYTTADASAGERLWSRCRSCHKLEDGVNGTGPHLYAVVGREIGVVDGFNYSEVLETKGEAWTLENLNAFIENPKGWAPGTRMNFNGLDDIEDRANLIAYIETFGG